MKHWLMGAAVLATGLIFANTPAGAFPPGAPAPPRALSPGMARPMPNPLNLTPVQQDKVKAVFAKFQPQIQKALKSVKTPEEARAKLAPFQKKMESEVMKILTPAQQKKYHALEAEGIKRAKAAAAATAPKK